MHMVPLLSDTLKWPSETFGQEEIKVLVLKKTKKSTKIDVGTGELGTNRINNVTFPH